MKLVTHVHPPIYNLSLDQYINTGCTNSEVCVGGSKSRVHSFKFVHTEKL